MDLVWRIFKLVKIILNNQWNHFKQSNIWNCFKEKNKFTFTFQAIKRMALNQHMEYLWWLLLLLLLLYLVETEQYTILSTELFKSIMCKNRRLKYSYSLIRAFIFPLGLKYNHQLTLVLLSSNAPFPSRPKRRSSSACK